MKIIASAKYKGQTENGLRHGDSYMVSIEGTRNMSDVVVQRVKTTDGIKYKTMAKTYYYGDVTDFLKNWEEITSYPTIS